MDAVPRLNAGTEVCRAEQRSVAKGQAESMLYLCLLIIEDCNLPLQSQFSRILIVQRVDEVREDWRHKVSAAGRGDTQISKGKAFLFCFVYSKKEKL